MKIRIYFQTSTVAQSKFGNGQVTLCRACIYLSRLGLRWIHISKVYPKKYAHGFCFTVLSCGYTLTDFPISIRLTLLALWQSNDCPSASKATLMNIDKYFMWINYEQLHNHNKAKHNKTMCIFLGIYCKGFPILAWMFIHTNTDKSMESFTVEYWVCISNWQSIQIREYISIWQNILFSLSMWL